MRRLIGYWASEREPHWPDPTRMVDAMWDDQQRQQVAYYLRTGQKTPWVSAGVSFCRLCGQSNGSGELMDDAFIWPEGLAHYVEAHAVRLPVEFVTHVVEQGSPEYWEGQVDYSWWRSLGER